MMEHLGVFGVQVILTTETWKFDNKMLSNIVLILVRNVFLSFSKMTKSLFALLKLSTCLQQT